MIIPVILAGGSGTRLWPVSRKSYPKQFSECVGNRSLFQDTVARLCGEGFAAPTVITSVDFRFITAEHLSDIGLQDATILLEPMARNTAPAILTAALHHAATPEALLLVSPSDHLVADPESFLSAVKAGKPAADAGAVVTFGIEPTYAETDYGYLDLAKAPELGIPQDLRRFVEKPDQASADRMLAGDHHLWNSGIYMFRVDAILKAFRLHASDLVLPCETALLDGKEDLCFFRLDGEAYGRCADISVDYAVMENLPNATVVPMRCGWSDLGSWRSMLGVSEQDGDGNALIGAATQIDCKGSFLRSDCDGLRMVGLGLENIAAIATDDAVLVARLDDSARVKEVVAELKRTIAPQAEEFRRCHRPWGYYETLSLGDRFQVKRIVVTPGAALSLQSHLHRAEHWVVVEGSAQVTLDDTVRLLSENQSVYVPLGAVHRLENRGKVPLTLIEVQSGAYLGEDDIIRYEDIYARASPEIAA